MPVLPVPRAQLLTGELQADKGRIQSYLSGGKSLSLNQGPRGESRGSICFQADPGGSAPPETPRGQEAPHGLGQRRVWQAEAEFTTPTAHGGEGGNPGWALRGQGSSATAAAPNVC